jgi:NADH dehydrogenase
VPVGRIFELGGPEVRTLRELVEYVLETTGRRRFILPLSWRAARLQGSFMGALDRAMLGLLPDDLVVTRDQVTLLERDNVVSPEAVRDGRTFEGLGIVPTGYQGIVPSYLVRFRKTGQFDGKRDALPSATPDVLAPDSTGPGSDFHPGRAAGPAIGQPSSR